jgi:hypothetical protein
MKVFIVAAAVIAALTFGAGTASAQHRAIHNGPMRPQSMMHAGPMRPSPMRPVPISMGGASPYTAGAYSNAYGGYPLRGFGPLVGPMVYPGGSYYPSMNGGSSYVSPAASPFAFASR